MTDKSAHQSEGRTTRVVSPEIFRQVYDSPLSLPGKHRWVTKDDDAGQWRTPRHSSEEHWRSAWVSGNTRHCPKCGLEPN